MMMKRNIENKKIGRASGIVIIILVLVLVIMGIKIADYQKCTLNIITWNYEQVSESFSNAAMKIEKGDDPAEEIEELAAESFANVEQICRLSRSCMFADDYYSAELDMFLLRCHSTQDMNTYELKAYENVVSSLAQEFRSIDWKKVRTDEAYADNKKAMINAIGKADSIIKNANL